MKANDLKFKARVLAWSAVALCMLGAAWMLMPW